MRRWTPSFIFADPSEQGIVLREALGVKSPRTALSGLRHSFSISGGYNAVTLVGILETDLFV